jgi:polysaccharide pyruvyl transferase WcaK-like protein
MKFVLPRVIFGNRGDLASRWGVLNTLSYFDIQDVTVFAQFEHDIPSLDYSHCEYGNLRNFFPNQQGRMALSQSDVVLWAVGLDMQDDSSMAKLVYLWLLFLRYRMMGLKIWCLFQGAGPITTILGRMLVSGILNCVDVFVARDPGTFDLISSVSKKTRLILGQDAIFLHGFETDLDKAKVNRYSNDQGVSKRLVIGVNIRQWFHFASSILPYEISRDKYRERSTEKMKVLIACFCDTIQHLRQKYDARIMLISAYQPNVVQWEDDLPWLQKIKKEFALDDEVVLLDTALSLPEYFKLMSDLDLMIGMRLHSSLIALRFGVPAINVSYTLKGKDIYSHLGLSDNVLDLTEVISDSQCLIFAADRVLGNIEEERERIKKGVSAAIDANMAILKNLLGASSIDR